MVFAKILPSYLLKTSTKSWYSRPFSKTIKKPPWKVLFFGADEFSIFSLKSLTQEYRNGLLLDKLEVVTTVKGKVKVFSEEQNLQIHKWSPDLVCGQFDVGLVVSFGHLIPANIIRQFEFGILNVHASLLPRWRGAAPIIYAIANGDTQTGITIMKISPDKFDVGEIVDQESVQIPPDMRMKELYRILGELGARSLVKTLETLPSSLSRCKPQPTDGVTNAPKVNASIACVKWGTMSSKQVYDLDRALDGVFQLQTTWKGTPIKLINVNRIESDEICLESRPGFVQYDGQNILKVLCSDFRFVSVEKIGVAGKKAMTSRDFNNGYLKKEPLECRYFE